jgi:hypothetical protein
VLPTVGLVALTELYPPEVAGTAIVTHVATGLLASAVYFRSGHLQSATTRRIAIVLVAAAAVGTPLGIVANSHVSKSAFSVLLGIVLALVAAAMYRHERRASRTEHSPPGNVVVFLAGCAVAVAAGIVGIGGPMLTVPTLTALGVAMLDSLAAAQVQSVMIAGIGTVGYAVQHAINWPLALLIGIPELAGVVLGWWVARNVPTTALRYALMISLLALAPYLMLHR